ncbi:MAG: IS1595 family transposase [Bifidobacteriaceae bacterium]|nr:IS1595 family transposase [Bifidobacteriaceae bacterium]
MEAYSVETPCLALLAQLRWPNGFVCPLCGRASATNLREGVARCLNCRRRVTVTTGTVMHGTKAPLSAWLAAAWLATEPGRGVSAREVQQRASIYSYQTAWMLLHRLRLALSATVQATKLSGEVSVDEVLLGRRSAGVPGRGVLGQRLVAVAVEMSHGEPGRVRFGLLPDAAPSSLRGFFRRCIEAGSVVVSDTWAAYPPACAGLTGHRVVDDAAAGGRVCPPGVAPIVRQLNEWLVRTHQASVGVKHLQRYLDEFAFRFDHRDDPPGQAFMAALAALMAAPPASYQELMGDVVAPPQKPDR